MLTRAGADALDALRQELDVEFAARLRDSRAYGDTTDNDDYLQIKEEEAVLSSRIMHLEAVLDAATIVEEVRSETGSVAVGSVATVRDTATGKLRDLRITGGYEQLREDEISANSPVGQALLGLAAGEEAAIELPNGTMRTLAVIAIR